MTHSSLVPGVDRLPVTVVVAQHNEMLCEGVCQLLRSQPDFAVVGVAQDGARALQLSQELRPHVLLLEIEIPETPASRVVALLRSAAPEVRTLLFGAVSETTALSVVAQGARGVLHHGVRPPMLFKSIRAVAAGEYWVSRALVNHLAQLVQSSGRRFGLTLRERQVTALVAAGCSNRDIAARCHLSAETVKHHLTSIFAKTGVATRVELAVFALHHGLAGREPDDLTADGPQQP